MQNKEIGTIIDYQPTVRGGIIYRILKRFFDFLLAFLAIIILSPAFIVIAIVIEFFNGHAIYVDKRAGKKGKPIGVLKFRTMYKDADENAEMYLNESQIEEFESERKVKNDPRVTKFGGFLRRSALDELPQLFNILVGQMSFVGPRAVTQREIDKNFTKEQAEALLKVRPGLTGSWCAYERYTATYACGTRQRVELEYLAKRSLWQDLKIFFATFGSIIGPKENKK